MPDISPYTFDQVKSLVDDAVDRAQERHEMWRAFEEIRRTGSVERATSIARTTNNAVSSTLDVLETLDHEVVNLVLPHLTLMLTTIVDRDPKFVVTPYAGGEEAEEASETARAVIDYWWMVTHATQALRDATADMLHLGPGFLKVLWEIETEDIELDDEERATLIAQAFSAENQRRSAQGQPLIEAADFAEDVELETEIIKSSRPHVEYVSPFDIFVPPNARRLEDARWVCHRVTLPLDEVRANDQFDVPDDLPVDGIVTEADKYTAEWKRRSDAESPLPQGKSEAMQTVTLYEFYDLRTRRLVVFHRDTETPLFDDEIPYEHGRAPFVMLRNYDVSGSEFWPFGDIENVARIQGMFNELLSKQIENARRSGNKYFLDADADTDEVREGLESDVDDVVIPVELGNRSMQDIVHAVTRQALSGDVYQAKLDLEDFMRRVLGINDFQAGGVGADRMSATAAAVVDGIATLRAQDKVASVEKGASDVASLLLLLSQEFMDEPVAIRVAEAEGGVWPEVTTEDLRGEFLFRVEGGSLKAMNPATREQRGLRLISEILPTVIEVSQLSGTPMDPMPILRSALRDMGYDPDSVLVPLEQPAGPPIGDPSAGGAAGLPLPGGEGAPPAAVPGAPPAAEQAQVSGDITI